MKPPPPLVVIVDDDPSVRESLPDLLVALGYAVRTFASSEAFLASGLAEDSRCLIADIAMPGMGGFALRDVLERDGYDLPIVFMTAHATDAVRRQAMESGAIAILAKPFPEEELLTAIEAALAEPRRRSN